MSDNTLVVKVSLTIRKRGGRKLVLSPCGDEIAPHARPRIDSTLVKALARAFRWRKLLETGNYATVADMADGILEAITDSDRRDAVTRRALDLYDRRYARHAYEDKMRRLLQLLG